jgi:hypothetical protein
MLPKVFAIFHQETETFKFLQPEFDADYKIVRLKPWYHDPQYGTGQEWFVVPTYNQGIAMPSESHRVVIHDNIYVFWSLRHSLVWSDYYVHACRRDDTKHEWMRSLKIPVIEFNSKLIYPRTDTNFYARWSSTPEKLIYELERGLVEYKRNMEVGFINIPIQYSAKEDEIDPKDLRIRTPVPKDDSDLEEEDNCGPSCYIPKGKKRSLSDVTDEVNMAAIRDFNPKTLCHLLSMTIGGIICCSLLRPYLGL